MAGKAKLIFKDVIRSLHQFWLEISGVLFIGFSAIFGLHAVQEYRKYTATTEGEDWQLVSATALSIVTFVFGIHSFWKSRKLRQ